MEKYQKEALKSFSQQESIAILLSISPCSVDHHNIQSNAACCQVETDAIRCVYIIHIRDYPRCY